MLSNITSRTIARHCSQRVAVVSKRSYHDNIIEHYENPRNVGSLDKNSEHVGTVSILIVVITQLDRMYNAHPLVLFQGLVGAPACGDVMKLQIMVDADGNITDSKFKTFGCGSAIASSSVATEWIKGKSVDEVLAIKNTDIAAHLKLPPVKLHCSMLAEDAIKAAVTDWKAKQVVRAAVAATK